MRFVYGQGWAQAQEETDGEGGAAAGGGGDGAGTVENGTGEDPLGGGDPAGGAGAGGKPAAGGGPKPAGEEPTAPKPTMLDEINAGLGYKPELNADGTKKAPEQKKVEDKKLEDKWPNGAPKKNAEGKDLDEAGKVIESAPKKKTIAELTALSEQERRGYSQRAIGRFQELTGAIKEMDSELKRVSTENKQLSEARSSLMSVLQETRTTQDALSGYLEFNAMVTSKEPKQMERALEILEQQRAWLYRALGKEPKGGDIDLLADFQDLKTEVEEERMPRERALELAAARREKAEREAEAQRRQSTEGQRQQQQQQQKQASDKALADIDAWTEEIRKTDLDYKAKEDRLLASVDGKPSMLDEVIKEYPPHLWLPTLKRLLSGITVEKTPAADPKGARPLRPSGARPGLPEPTSMKQALDQGLGYT